MVTPSGLEPGLLVARGLSEYAGFVNGPPPGGWTPDRRALIMAPMAWGRGVLAVAVAIAFGVDCGGESLGGRSPMGTHLRDGNRGRRRHRQQPAVLR